MLQKVGGVTYDSGCGYNHHPILSGEGVLSWWMMLTNKNPLWYQVVLSIYAGANWGAFEVSKSLYCSEVQDDEVCEAWVTVLGSMPHYVCTYIEIIHWCNVFNVMINNQRGDMIRGTSWRSLCSSFSTLESLEQSVECGSLSDLVILQTERLDFNKLILYRDTAYKLRHGDGVAGHCSHLNVNDLVSDQWLQKHTYLYNTYRYKIRLSSWSVHQHVLSYQPDQPAL